MNMEGIGTPHPTDDYRYNGKELNDDFGLDLYDYGARWYDAGLGRFSSVDPLAADFAAWSPFSYTFNNPIRFIDPDGRAPSDPMKSDDCPWPCGEVENQAESLVNYVSEQAQRGTEFLGELGNRISEFFSVDEQGSSHPGGTEGVSEKASAQMETSTYTENAETIDLTEFIQNVPPGTQQLQRVSVGLKTLDNWLDGAAIGKEAVSVVPDVLNRAVDFAATTGRAAEKLKPKPDTVWQLGTNKIEVYREKED